MALYKVIGNYYSSVLDFINGPFLKNNRDFDKAYSSLDQKELILLLADTVVRIESLKASEMGYWKSRNSQYKMYMAIFIIIIILVFFAFAWFWNMMRKEIKDLFLVVRSTMVYIIIYLVIFLPVFLLVYNVSKLQKQAEFQYKKINEEFDNVFISFLLKGDKSTILYHTLLYIGYLSKKKKNDAKNIKDKFSPKKGNNKDRDAFKSYTDLIQKMDETNFSVELRNGQLASDIKDCMKQFFANGRGYYNLKRLIVSQSNVYMMRETRRIINYYYYLSIKKSSQQNIELSEQNMLKTIKEKVIDPIVKRQLSVLQQDQQTYLEFIDELATDLVPYNIDLVKQTKYITAEIQAKVKDMSTKDMEFLNELLNRLNKTIFVKQQTSLSKLVGISDDQKYLDPADFIQNIYDMTFADFYQGFEITFLKDIVDDFYDKNTKSQAYKGGKNADNIYFEREKSIDVYEKFMFIFFILIFLSFIYYGSVIYDEYKEISDFKKKQTDQAQQITDQVQKVKRMNSIAKETAKLLINWWIKLLIPLAALIFIVALIYSYYQKKREVFFYNKDMIQSNTSEFKESIHKLEEKLIYLNGKIARDKKLSKITNIQEFTDEDKFEMFAHIKNVVDKFEKCNFIMESSNIRLPFPYTEIVMDVFMILVLVTALMYIFAKLQPIEKINKIKTYNIMAEKVKSGINDKEFNDKLDINEQCHDEDMDSIIYTLKLIVFIFILVFLLFYATKLLSSSAEFRGGLYNSNYFEESRCYD